MFSSDRLLSRLAKLRKSDRTAGPEQLSGPVHAAFVGLLSHLPSGMADAIFDQFWEVIIRRDAGSPLVDRAKYLADVADLFCGEYDSDADPLANEDWEIVGDLVNDYAVDMDMHLVTGIMQRVVEHSQ